ncbi:MAG: cytochrome c [Rhodoferax sp.]|nr:cytochrome c [Rhodoferax sp.]
MKKTSSLILASAMLFCALPATAQFAKPEDAIKYRKNALFVMQQNFGRVAGMAKVAADSAATADFVAKLPWAAFGPGTDKGDTKALPEIWTQKAKFDDYASKMQTEMSKLAVAAKSGNLDSIKTAVNATGGTCKSCHDDFRAK